MQFSEVQWRDLSAAFADEMSGSINISLFCQPRVAWRNPLEKLIVLFGDMIAVVIAKHDLFHAYSIGKIELKVKSRKSKDHRHSV